MAGQDGGAGTRGDTRGDRTRSTVLAVARARFAAEDYDGTTLGRIAADAGVSSGTVVFHFGSKAGLLVAVMETYYDELLTAVDDVLDPASPPPERLRAFARWWLEHNADSTALLSVFGRHGRRTEPDPIVTAFRACNRRVTRRFEALVEELKHAGVLAERVPTRVLRDAFFGTAEHLLVGRLATGRPDDLATAADDLVDLLLHGAARSGAPPRSVEDRLRSLEEKVDRLLPTGDLAG